MYSVTNIDVSFLKGPKNYEFGKTIVAKIVFM